MREGAIALILLALLAGCTRSDARGRSGDPSLLTIRLDPAGNDDDDGPAGDDGRRDAALRGIHFSAIAWLPCAGPDGHLIPTCPAGIVRKPDGSADVTVIWPDSRTRTLFFDAGGEVTGADLNRADGSNVYLVRSARQVPDLRVVTIGAERYEIPDGFLRGA